MPGDTDNPFEDLRRQKHLEQLLVAFHAPSLRSMGDDDRLVVERFVSKPDDWGLRAFAVGGDRVADTPLPQLVFRPVPGAQGDQRAAAWGTREEGVLNWGGLDEWGSGLGSLGVALQQLEYRLDGNVPNTAHDVRAAHEVGAHVVVTSDRDLLRLRDTPGLREINLLSPLEAAVVIGVWARSTGRGGTFAHWSSSEFMYYWALTRAVTPSGWPAFAAFVHGRRVYPEGVRLEALAQSILTRLDYLAEALDSLFFAWQRETTNPVIDEIASLVDSVLLRGWAIQDNVALLVSLWYGLDVRQPTSISLHEREWRRAVRAKGPDARATIDVLQRAASPLGALSELRHHAVHREALAALRVHSDDDSEHVRLFVPAPIAGPIRAGLRSARQSVKEWGMGDEREPAVVHNSVDHGDGLVEEYTEPSEGGVYLEPMLFAANFVARVAHLAETTYRSLAPADDPRLPPELRRRALTPTTEGWAKPEAAREILLTSPLSGLITGPVGDQRSLA